MLRYVRLSRSVLQWLRLRVESIMQRTIDVDHFVTLLFTANDEQLNLRAQLYVLLCECVDLVFRNRRLVGIPKEISIYRVVDIPLLLRDACYWWLLHVLGRNFQMPDGRIRLSFCAGHLPSTSFFLSAFNNGSAVYTGEVLLAWLNDAVPTLF